MRISDWSSDVCSSDLEPRGCIVGAEHALELKGAHALLAGGHELSGQHPLGQLDLAALHDGADSHGEGLAAFFALMHARPGGLALELGNAVGVRSEEHTSELQSLMRNSYAVFCLKKKTKSYYIIAKN